MMIGPHGCSSSTVGVDSASFLKLPHVCKHAASRVTTERKVRTVTSSSFPISSSTSILNHQQNEHRNSHLMMKRILVIAGSDSSGGAYVK